MVNAGDARHGSQGVERGSILTCAHRGWCRKHLENTPGAISDAISLGVDLVEIDVRNTADDRLILSHDATLDRLAGWSGSIAGSTYRELLKHPLPDGEPVALLEDVLSIIDGSGTRLNIEIKAFGCEQGILDLVHAMNMEDQVMYSSFLFPVLMELHELDPAAVTCPLLARVCSLKVDDLLAQVRLVDATYLNLEHHCITPSLVIAAHHAGIGVQAWTPDTRADLQRAIDLGVDIIITNEPALLLDMLGSRSSTFPVPDPG